MRLGRYKPEIGSLICWMFLLFVMFSRLPLLAAQTGPRERPTGPTKSCTAGGCHSDVTAYPVLHGPMRVSACSACHRQGDVVKHTFQLTRQGGSLCLFCHKLETGAYSHKPMTEKTCLECHNPHGGETRPHLRAKTTRALCEKCHAKTIKGKMVHKPVADGGCLGCHTAHVSNRPKLLRQEPSKVCLDCHVVFATRMKEARSIHKPMEEGCLKCHDAHASDRPKLLEKPMRELCYSCHENIQLTVEHAKVRHGALEEIRECMNCHDAHATRYAKLLRNSARALCLKCHDKEIQTSRGKIRDMSKVLASGNSIHVPNTANECSACHQIHGGDLFDLLNKEYPSEFYSSFREENYALCFSCHDPRLAAVSKTMNLTGFRNGDMNLHSVHVNQKDKGRTCRACHEIHAIDRDQYVRDSVSFGDWKFQTGYAKTATGGSCTPGCHQHFSYDRQNPVEYKQDLEKSGESGKEGTQGGK